MAHRSGRVIDTDTLISLVLHVSSDCQEREQGPEDNPGVNAHQSSPAAVLPLNNSASTNLCRSLGHTRRAAVFFLMPDAARA
jgi:hypothetical protein